MTQNTNIIARKSKIPGNLRVSASKEHSNFHDYFVCIPFYLIQSGGQFEATSKTASKYAPIGVNGGHE